MTSTEWAAWVQAIGSVLAIVAAALIAHAQHKRDLARDLASEERALSRRREALSAVIDSLRLRMSAVRLLLDIDDWIPRAVGAADALGVYADTISHMDHGLLTKRVWFPFAELQAGIREVVTGLKSCASLAPNTHQYMRDILREELRRLEDVAASVLEGLSERP